MASVLARGYLWARNLSLDVALGACGSATLVARAAGVPLGPDLLVLPVVVWLVYTLDHLLDARRISHPAHTPRHRFHQRWFRLIATIWLVVASLTAAYGVCCLPWRMFELGFGVGLLVLLHLVLVSWVRDRVSLWLQKEAGVALIYVAGVSVPALAATAVPLSTQLLTLLPVLGALFLAALCNLLCLAWWEAETDRADAQTSWVLVLGPARSRILIIAAGAAGAAWALATFAYRANPNLPEAAAWLMLACLNGLQVLPVLQPTWFASAERYRSIGDAAFVLPLLLWLL